MILSGIPDLTVSVADITFGVDCQQLISNLFKLYSNFYTLLYQSNYKTQNNMITYTGVVSLLN